MLKKDFKMASNPKANWDIKNPVNYPVEKSCTGFLDRVAKDVNFNFETSAFPKSVGDRASFLSHICDSEEKALTMIKRVGEIIKALLERSKLIPGLIHSNNMLWRRGELLRKLLEHYGNLAQKLEEEMRVLLNQLAYMAFQLHTLMNALNIQYDPATGVLKDNTGTVVTNERKDLLGIDDRMKDLLETLGSISGGTLFGQKLALDSTPRFSMKFKNADFTAANQDQIASELAALLSSTMAKLGSSSPIPADDIKQFTRFKEGSLIVLVQLTEDYIKEKSVTEEQRKYLQMAMFQIAFTTPIDATGALGTLYTNELPALPEFEMPGLTEIPENSPDEWKDALQKDFGLDMTKFSASKALPAVKKDSAASSSVRSSVEPSNLGLGGIEITGPASNDAKLLLAYNAFIAKNPQLSTSLTFDIWKGSEAYKLDAATATSAERASSSRRRGSARRRSNRRKSSSSRRGSSARSRSKKYQGELLLDFVAITALLSELKADMSILQPITADDVTSFLKTVNPVEGDLNFELLRELAAMKENTIITSVEEIFEEVPLFIRLANGETLVVLPKSNVEVAGSIKDFSLKAETDSKTIMLARIKALAESNEVKEFIRVRPYNDKDIRATELQLGTVDQKYDRSPDPSVIIGHLATVVDYKKSCLIFTKLFQNPAVIDGKQEKVPYFEKFQAFIPKGKTPKPNEWFSTVNGGVFFEPKSYEDEARSEDKIGIKEIKTDMLKVRKQVSTKIQYQWVTKEGTLTTNDDPNKLFIKAITPKADTISELSAQLKNVDSFKTIFTTWSRDNDAKRAQLETLISETTDMAAKKTFEEALRPLPIAANYEREFLNEYYKNRVLSESINAEFVDTVWPVLQIFFGLKTEDGMRSPDTKNIVTLFYGASGSGKTFSAEAILKKCFDEIMNHEDQFQLKIVSDYNDDLYDYYSAAGNLKRLTNEFVYDTKLLGKDIGEKTMRKQQFNEMASRAQYLNWDPVYGGKPPPLVFWEGNPSDKIKENFPNPTFIQSLGVYNPNSFNFADLKSTDQKKPSRIDANSTIENDIVKEPKVKKQTGFDALNLPVADFSIPSYSQFAAIGKTKADADAAFDRFKVDFEKRVVAFRSVTDTGLNPESSRSHLLYIIVRTTKNGQPLGINQKGAQFILADFAGTEDLNYLMTPDAWKLWKAWAPLQKKGKTSERMFTDDEVNGNCLLAGKEVKGDWACVDLPAFANMTALGDERAEKAAFRKALVDGWKKIKVKTLVAKEISEEPVVPKANEFQAYQDNKTKQWEEKLAKPFFHPGGISAKDIKLIGGKGFFPEISIPTGFYTLDEIKKLRSTVTDAYDASPTKRLNDGFELNPYRFRELDNDNDDIICNMVLAMHAESKHINDSLKEITNLIKAQREAIEKNTNGGKADKNALIDNKLITKKLIINVLADAVVAGSAAVTIGAMNPRRTNDWETYKTMVNITSMDSQCKVDATAEKK